jgi:uncharacterized lipoprotein YajG
MRREAIMLVLAMFVGTLLTAACDQPKQPPTAPRASAQAKPNVDPSLPKVALGAATAEERREGAVPVQGEVDPKEPAQRQDFEQKK